MLCGGSSAREVIRERVATRPRRAEFVPPSIRFLLPGSKERVVLVLEQSPAMGRRWSSVLASTFQYISGLREGTELAIITFGETAATVHLQPTVVQGGNREGLHYRIPRRLAGAGEGEGGGRTGEACLECGMIEAVIRT